MRIPSSSLSNGNINFNGYPQMNGVNGYNPNPTPILNLVSPKAGPVYSQPNPSNAALNRTF